MSQQPDEVSCFRRAVGGFVFQFQGSGIILGRALRITGHGLGQAACFEVLGRHLGDAAQGLDCLRIFFLFVQNLGAPANCLGPSGLDFLSRSERGQSFFELAGLFLKLAAKNIGLR